jgi:hypothetical protein
LIRIRDAFDVEEIDWTRLCDGVKARLASKNIERERQCSGGVTDRQIDRQCRYLRRNLHFIMQKDSVPRSPDKIVKILLDLRLHHRVKTK